jgi:type VI secretion system secreted protein VgrG
MPSRLNPGWRCSTTSPIAGVYQKTSIPDIVKEVFRTYGQLEYVVQHSESDFNFVSRLMQQAGIYYFFTHE